MDIYDIDFSFQDKNLMSPIRRTDNTLALCNVYSSGLQRLRDLMLGDFKKGAEYEAYNNGQGYVMYDRVKWTDKGVYELQVATSTSVDPTGEALSTTNWRRIIDNYIGTDERMRYNSQTINLCYSINKWFGITAPDYIWIENYQVAGTAFNLHFPVAVYTALGSSTANRNSRIDQFIQKFLAPGMIYTVTTF